MVQLYICIFTTCMPDTCRGQKRAYDPLEQELQVAMACHVGDGNQAQDLRKNSKCFLTSLSSLQSLFFPFEDCTLISYMLILYSSHFFPIKGNIKYTVFSNLSVLCIVNKAYMISFNLNGGFHSHSVRSTADLYKFKDSWSAE